MQISGDAGFSGEDQARILRENEQLRTEKLELENSNHILRKFKRIYQQVGQVRCKGCREAFEPLAFKGHVLNCRHLESLEGNQASSASQRDLESLQMTVKASQVDRNGQIRFVLSYCGLSWFTDVKLEEV